MGPASSDVFCMMPWVHLHVTQKGTVTPCCQAPWGPEGAFGDINHQSLEEIWSGEGIRAFRSAMLRGEPDPRCARCHEKERSGLLSLRQVTNEDYAHRIDWARATSSDGTAPDARPVYLDIRFSNVCNFGAGYAVPTARHAGPRTRGRLETFKKLPPRSRGRAVTPRL